MKLRTLIKELNLFGLDKDWQRDSLRAYLKYNGYEVVGNDWGEYEYSDIKAYLDVEVRRI